MVPKLGTRLPVMAVLHYTTAQIARTIPYEQADRQPPHTVIDGIPVIVRFDGL
jgi:hypothetical protein